MDAVEAPYDIRWISQRVELIKRKYLARDARATDVREVRRGNFEAVAPDLFSDDWPRPVVANLIDASARHASAALAPLPSFSCSASSNTDAAKKFADKRTKIANNYVQFSRVKRQMISATDQYFSYGMIVANIEPDFDARMPRIVYEDSMGVYPVWDRRTGRTVEVARVFYREMHELCAEYPQHAKAIQDCRPGAETGAMEVVKYVSDKHVVLYLPQARHLVLHYMPNPIGRCFYVCTQKPGLDEEIRGNFDDLIWVQLARHRFQMLAMEAADKAVRAPLVVPPDVGDVPLGPDAIIRTANGVQSVGRARLDVPAQTWASIQHLKDEMRSGSITPEAMDGSIDASVVTGRGLQELAAGFSQQIASAQDVLVGHFEDVLELCFRTDEKLWPNREHVISVSEGAERHSVKYTPAKDIAGDYTVDVNYGFLAGLDANRALVYMLQAQGAGLLSDDYVMRNLPAQIDASDEKRKIMVEQMEKSTIQSLSGLAQAIPQMVLNGMDPTQVVGLIAEVTRRVRKGEAIDKVISEVFAPEPPPAPSSPADALATGAPGSDASGAGGTQDPTGDLVPGEMVGGPTERPDMAQLFAGISASGNPVLQGGVSRWSPVA